ncbi:selenoprotein W [Lingula anatina]|uniref:Selenoprotein W n=1 Tax=Lingula anatina TaxID=7574 RepID=A0A1S3JPH8_LINAN|nr:selenoprotein W [Lingula anatina]|eukprot:XP_013412270.2 selenoprotein W [Lingula anatina]
MAACCPPKGEIFRRLKADLEQEFGTDVVITGEGTPQATGYFEVQIENGKLLHSKKNGDGYVDSEAKFHKITKGIEEALKS